MPLVAGIPTVYTLYVSFSDFFFVPFYILLDFTILYEERNRIEKISFFILFCLKDPFFSNEVDFSFYSNSNAVNFIGDKAFEML